MHAVPSSRWGLTSESYKASIERLYQRLQWMGYLHRDEPGTLALVQLAGDSLFRSIHKNPAHVLRPMTFDLERVTMFSPQDDTIFLPSHLHKKLTSQALYSSKKPYHPK